MKDKEFEQMLEQVLGQDFSAGTEAFRDALLKRCLAILGQGEQTRELDDGELALLAAAGSPNATQNDKQDTPLGS